MAVAERRRRTYAVRAAVTDDAVVLFTDAALQPLTLRRTCSGAGAAHTEPLGVAVAVEPWAAVEPAPTDAALAPAADADVAVAVAAAGVGWAAAGAADDLNGAALLRAKGFAAEERVPASDTDERSGGCGGGRLLPLDA